MFFFTFIACVCFLKVYSYVILKLSITIKQFKDNTIYSNLFNKHKIGVLPVYKTKIDLIKSLGLIGRLLLSQFVKELFKSKSYMGESGLFQMKTNSWLVGY